jgi:hypothetical protein
MPLARAGEDRVVVADHRAAAQRGKADVAIAPRAGVAVARAHAVLSSDDAAALRRRLAQHQRGAGGASTFMRWCISTISMSKSSAERRGDLAHQAASRLTPRLILPERTMVAWRAAAASLASSASDSPVVPTTWTMRAWAASSAKPDGGGGRGEVEHPVGPGEQRQRVVGDLDAKRAETRQRSGIGADLQCTRPLDGAGQPHPVALGHRAHQRAAHAPGGPGNDQPHLGHSPFSPGHACCGPS